MGIESVVQLFPPDVQNLRLKKAGGTPVSEPVSSVRDHLHEHVEVDASSLFILRIK